MSWYGDHPGATREEAKKALPARACRLCIYRMRLLLDDKASGRGMTWTMRKPCSRCGTLFPPKET